MAISIDKAWVEKEIRDFNRGLSPYGFNEPDRLETVTKQIAGHFLIRDPRLKMEFQKDLARHLEMSLELDPEDNETGKLNTDAQEIAALLDRGPSNAAEVVEKILGDD